MGGLCPLGPLGPPSSVHPVPKCALGHAIQQGKCPICPLPNRPSGTLYLVPTYTQFIPNLFTFCRFDLLTLDGEVPPNLQFQLFHLSLIFKKIIMEKVGTVDILVLLQQEIPPKHYSKTNVYKWFF